MSEYSHVTNRRLDLSLILWLSCENSDQAIRGHVAQSGDRGVTRTQLLELLHAASAQEGRDTAITEEEIDLVYALFDEDKDGRLDYKEYLAFCSRWKQDMYRTSK